jgi:hypothetical protein
MATCKGHAASSAADHLARARNGVRRQRKGPAKRARHILAASSNAVAAGQLHRERWMAHTPGPIRWKYRQMINALVYQVFVD